MFYISFYLNMELRIKGDLVGFEKPLVMGILNLTPDSFYYKSRLKSPDDAIHIISEMFENGADIIDIGALSTRPGAAIISEKEEWQRYLPVLEVILKHFSDKIFSIDTFRAEIARNAVKDYGISIINDITGGEYDPEMFRVVSDCKIPYILMHMVGLPENMQNNIEYDSLMADIILYLSKKVEQLKLL